VTTLYNGLRKGELRALHKADPKFRSQAQRWQRSRAARRHSLCRAEKKSQLPEAPTLLNRDEEGAMTHRQLTLEERYHVEVWSKERLSQAEIARRLARSASTISRELRRNEDRFTRRYAAARAEQRAQERRIAKGERSRKIQGELKDLIEQKLMLSWSPEQISGRLQLERGVKISHETIYQHVLRDSRRRGWLRYCLRFGGYKHHRFKKSRMAERTRERKNWLEDRPVEANERSEIGHWERDCIVGTRGGAALLTLIDRKTRYTRIRRVPRQNSGAVAEATIAALASCVTKTITNDNGAEFQRDDRLQRELGVPIYFTEPSAPWQRGSIENLNGLVRQYVRKRTDVGKLPEQAFKALEQALNYRPRKCLFYRTPHEAFHEEKNVLLKGSLLRLGLEFSCLI
jgi:transposase, IS30 family